MGLLDKPTGTRAVRRARGTRRRPRLGLDVAGSRLQALRSPSSKLDVTARLMRHPSLFHADLRITRPMAQDERVMHRPTPHRPAPAPVLRAAVFAVVGAVLGVSAHHLSAEGAVPWAQGSAVAAGLFGLGLVGVRRPRHVGTVVACSVVGQSGLHLWLTLTAHTRPPAPHHGTHMRGAHAGTYDSTAMAAAHALVAVLVAVLLHRADAACWTLAHSLTAVLDAARAHVAAARRLFTRPRSTVRLGPPVRVPVADTCATATGPVLAYAVVRRGPPPSRSALVN